MDYGVGIYFSLFILRDAGKYRKPGEWVTSDALIVRTVESCVSVCFVATLNQNFIDKHMIRQLCFWGKNSNR
mgnify:CR=1